MGKRTDESNPCRIRDYLGLSRKKSRKDICVHLGKDPSTNLETLFQHVGLNYNYHLPKRKGFYIQKPYFLVNIVDYTIIPYRTGSRILEEVLLASVYNTNILREYIERKFLVLYSGCFHVVCDNLSFETPFDIGVGNPHSLVRIRQKLRFEGYPVDCTTTLGEICDRLNISRDQKSLKKKICDRLEIRYFPPHAFDPRNESIPCFYLRLNTGEIESFESTCQAGRYFNLHHRQIQSYIENQVEFHFEHELYRVYYS